jgi:thiosulfate/3-mercaptopyruvate sulfurtransferase
MTVTVDPDQVHRWRSEGRRLVLLDVRWSLGDPHGRDHCLAGHLPGAVFADLESDLAGPASPEAGRHPLPSLPDLQRTARRWGTSRDSTVVAYDDTGGMAAARAWWLLRWAGLEAVHLLDGGLAAWRAAGLPLEAGEVLAALGDAVLPGGRLPVVDADGAAALAGAGVLLDARAGERYRGEVEPIDPRAGHIPGALSAPTAANLDAGGRFLPADQLRQRFVQLGVDGSRPVGVYCGSGVTAAHEIAALAIAGFDAALYPGSWSQWSADPRRPAAVISPASPPSPPS